MVAERVSTIEEQAADNPRQPSEQLRLLMGVRSRAKDLVRRLHRVASGDRISLEGPFLTAEDHLRIQMESGPLIETWAREDRLIFDQGVNRWRDPITGKFAKAESRLAVAAEAGRVSTAKYEERLEKRWQPGENGVSPAIDKIARQVQRQAVISGEVNPHEGRNLPRRVADRLTRDLEPIQAESRAAHQQIDQRYAENNRILHQLQTTYLLGKPEEVVTKAVEKVGSTIKSLWQKGRERWSIPAVPQFSPTRVALTSVAAGGLFLGALSLAHRVPEAAAFGEIPAAVMPTATAVPGERAEVKDQPVNAVQPTVPQSVEQLAVNSSELSSENLPTSAEQAEVQASPDQAPDLAIQYPDFADVHVTLEPQEDGTELPFWMFTRQNIPYDPDNAEHKALAEGRIRGNNELLNFLAGVNHLSPDEKTEDGHLRFIPGEVRDRRDILTDKQLTDIIIRLDSIPLERQAEYEQAVQEYMQAASEDNSLKAAATATALHGG